ncbi:MAG: DegQ family serine endoprotease [Nitrospirae bacterium]|nr:DegQ family serine endoprotease [Nitrospirota bacterium]
MKYRRSHVAMTLLIFVCLVAGPFGSPPLALYGKAYAEEPVVSAGAVDILSKTSRAMAEVVAAVKPAVVNISSTQTIRTRGMTSPFQNDPFLRRFFGDQFGELEKPREHKQASLGSGVIVDKQGYILTNNHVIKNADAIKVKLSDNREFKGKVIGSDPKTDLAVVKIEADHLPLLRLGNSDRLRPGEMVIAIGNPFGLSQTVTSGIVSATGRANVGIADYEDFIQTDAAINPGNSGGALVNIRGKLVGINTAIFSTSGGYQGIGFAIPSNMAKVVMEDLIRNGKVVRGWLGVTIQPITPDLAKQFGLRVNRGVLIADVVEGSPAEKAGLRRGDVVTAYNGKEVGEPSHLRNMVADTPPAKEVVLRILREGKTETVKVTIAELPGEIQKESGTFDNLLKGVYISDITPEVRRSLRIPKRIAGVLVADIAAGSAAAGALAKNDVIMEVNRKRTKNAKEYDTVVSKIKPGQNVLVLVFRKGSTLYVTLAAR